MGQRRGPAKVPRDGLVGLVTEKQGTRLPSGESRGQSPLSILSQDDGPRSDFSLGWDFCAGFGEGGRVLLLFQQSQGFFQLVPLDVADLERRKAAADLNRAFLYPR